MDLGEGTKLVSVYPAGADSESQSYGSSSNVYLIPKQEVGKVISITLRGYIHVSFFGIKTNQSIEDPLSLQTTQLYSTSGASGGDLNVNYKTLSYTITQTDVDNDYLFYIMLAGSAGKCNVSYEGISSYSIGERRNTTT